MACMNATIRPVCTEHYASSLFQPATTPPLTFFFSAVSFAAYATIMFA